MEQNASDATTEPRVAGTASPAAVGRILRLEGGDARRVDPAHLPGADADGGAVLDVDDGVRLDVLGDPEGKAQVASSCAVGARLVTVVSCISSTTALSRDCTKSPPATDLTVMPGARGSGTPPASSRRRFFLAPTIAIRFLARLRRDDHLGEDLVVIARAASASSGRFNATMPPKAETGSQASALR